MLSAVRPLGSESSAPCLVLQAAARAGPSRQHGPWLVWENDRCAWCPCQAGTWLAGWEPGVATLGWPGQSEGFIVWGGDSERDLPVASRTPGLIAIHPLVGGKW